MKTMRKILCLVVAIAMVTCLMTNTAEAATKVKLNKKKVTLTITNTKKKPTTTLKVKGVSKKVAKKAKWTSSKKSVATVKKGKVTARKAGKTTITCKVKGKKYTCKVTVVDKRTPIDSTGLEVIVKKSSEVKHSYQTSTHKTSDGEYVAIDSVTATKRDGTTVVYSDDTKFWHCCTDLNKITVNYNGKDVTNEVDSKITDKYSKKRPERSNTIDKNGTIHLRHTTDFSVVINYKGMKKTLNLKVERVNLGACVCYCGDHFYGTTIEKAIDEREAHVDFQFEGRTWISEGPNFDGRNHMGFFYFSPCFIDVVPQ